MNKLASAQAVCQDYLEKTAAPRWFKELNKRFNKVYPNEQLLRAYSGGIEDSRRLIVGAYGIPRWSDGGIAPVGMRTGHNALRSGIAIKTDGMRAFNKENPFIQKIQPIVEDPLITKSKNRRNELDINNLARFEKMLLDSSLPPQQHIAEIARKK